MGRTFCLLPGLAQRLQLFEITCDESFLFPSRPPLQLTFALGCSRYGLLGFRMDNLNGSTSCGIGTSATGIVSVFSSV